MEEFKLKNNKNILLNEQNFVNISLPQIQEKLYYKGVKKLNRLKRWSAVYISQQLVKSRS